MPVESNYAVTIATLSGGFKSLAPVFQPIRRKTSCSLYVRFFCALSKFQVIATNSGSSCCFFLLWLVGVTTLVLVFRQSFEKFSFNQNFVNFVNQRGRKLVN